jgi:hypothetical protein
MKILLTLLAAGLLMGCESYYTGYTAQTYTPARYSYYPRYYPYSTYAPYENYPTFSFGIGSNYYPNYYRRPYYGGRRWYGGGRRYNRNWR